jgi:hypothetical protein
MYLNCLEQVILEGRMFIMMRGDALISPLLQEELDKRVADAGGNIDTVRHELEHELEQLEATAVAAEQPQLGRRDAALILAEMEYLDEEKQTLESASHAAHQGFMARMRHAVGMN